MSYILPPNNRLVLLRPDNFTPATRTPWGGTRILDFKKHLRMSAVPAVVGESWEVSFGPLFPSVLEDGRSLPEVMPDAHGSSLLVKLVDAADELSVQIHPGNAYAGLRPGEGGKPESWYVVCAAPDAAIYFGLRDGVTRERMAAAIGAGEDVSALLARVPVAIGDFFLIEPGTAHAIGRGVTIVEPQRVTRGREGLTYRYWDWNRRYDETGRLDPAGTPRALHVEHALAVTAWDAPREDALLARVRRRLGPVDLGARATLEPLCGTSGEPVWSGDLAVARVAGTGRVTLAARPWLRAITAVDGAITARSGDERATIERGRSAVLAGGAEHTLNLDRAHAIVSAAP